MAAKKNAGSLSKAAGKMGEAGGPARAAVLPPARRAAIAREGGLARVRKHGKK